MWGAIGITFHGNGRHCDEWACGKALFQVQVSVLPFRQPETPAVIMDHDVHMIGIIEGSRTLIKRSVVKIPFWGGGLPDELCKIVCVFFIAGLTTLCGKIILVPPLKLGC